MIVEGRTCSRKADPHGKAIMIAKYMYKQKEELHWAKYQRFTV